MVHGPKKDEVRKIISAYASDEKNNSIAFSPYEHRAP